MKRTCLTFSIGIAVLLSSPNARGQWQRDGFPVCTAPISQADPAIVSDGAGGAIVAWADYRNGVDADIYVQRLDAAGTPLWTANGVALCMALNGQFYPTIVSDGAGGAIVTWHDWRSGNADIYVRRVNASGTALWTADGVALCTAGNDQTFPLIVSDGAGGAIVTWDDLRSGVDDDVYARRVDSSGTALWTANGVALCTGLNTQFYPAIASDGAGGAIVTWQDYRNGIDADIYARRVNASGTALWTANGVALCALGQSQWNPKIVSDDAGGAIVTWEDLRNGANIDIYAGRVDASGTALWTANGVALCVATNQQQAPSIASDGAGGAIVAWMDYRSGTGTDIYVRRVDAAGTPQWTADGVALCTASSDQDYPRIVSDGSGGAIVTWMDFRNGVHLDIYARRVDDAGTPLWNWDGVALCTADRDQLEPRITSDGSGGAMVTWHDYRSGPTHIFAQRVETRYGYWGRPEPAIVSVSDIPYDQGGRVKVNWTRSGWDELDLQTITYYSIWRATEFVPLSATLVAGASEIGPDFKGAAYRKERLLDGPEYYWEWVGNQNALYSPRYSFSAATRSDSTSQGTSPHYFQVVAHTWSQFTFWPSNVGTGHSVDNLAPAAPLVLTAQRVGSDVRLRWNRVVVPDLRDYSVYRAASSGVTPVPINFLASADDTTLVDANAPASALYYIVTAYDVHENQSVPSNEASVSPTTNVGKTPPIAGLTVLPNHPNPFTGSTDFEIGLPANSNLTIGVYDVAGRRVKQTTLIDQKAGWRRVAFDGRDDSGRPLASGVYFYRVTANGSTLTRKMVIAR